MYYAQITKDRIKSLCKIRKINMEDMLSHCNLGVNAIRQINDAKGMASFSLAKIADYLECSVDYLLGRTDEAGSPTPSDRQIRQLDLSGNELTIVKLFEKLSETQQGELIGRAKLMAEQNDENYMQDGTA